MEQVIEKRKQTSLLRKGIIWMLSVMVVLAGGTVLAGIYFVKRPLPQVEGEQKLKGLIGTVEVRRDDQGVPHIKASNEHDLFFAQGYIQAQDRMFQMDLSRRQASGRLSEVIGEDTLKNDKYFRTLGLRRAAAASYSSYSKEAQAVLKAFSDGVNAYISEREKNGKWPIEFTILGYHPEKWTPEDSLTIGKYMAFDLGGNWDNQAFRHYLLQNLPKEKAYELFPSYPKSAPFILKEEELNLRESLSKAVIPHAFNGSNNWVISGEKTKSGKPLLADDPHLGLATPSVWYQTHLISPDLNVSGVIFAGIPGVILGHNEHVAWGVTNVGPDVQDLYIEKKNPDRDDEYLFKGDWEKAKVVKEEIKIKDKKTIQYPVTITRHGPVVSEFMGKSNQDYVLSLKWTALDPSNELEAVLNMNKAKNWKEFEQALENFHTPAQNFVFASVDGTIAYKANGKIPIRQEHHDALLPVEGWTGKNEWKGFIPFEQLPKTINPEKGYISTANNKVTPERYPYHLSHDWAQPYRQMRIQQFLTTKKKFTSADMKALQMDKKNLQAEEFVPVFLSHLPSESNKKHLEAITLLKKWNYIDSRNEAAPLLFHMWMEEISHTLFAGQIPDDMLKLFRGKKQAVDQLIRQSNEGKPSKWIEEQGGLETMLATSLEKAVKKGRAVHGEDLTEWKWGNSHHIQFKHPLSAVKPLHYLFNPKGQIPAGGSAVTVQAASANEEGIVNHGGSWRFVADLADLSKAEHLVGPGQSGQPMSNWYQNQMEDWVEGDYHTTKLKEPGGVLLRLLAEGR